MTQHHRRRPSDHPLIDTVWATQNIEDGVYLATPDGAWDFIVLVYADGKKRMMLTGQATKAATVPYQKGTSSVVISFLPGACLTTYPARELIDSFVMLPEVDDDHFMLADRVFAYPTFDTAEVLVEKLVAEKLLYADPVVYAAFGGHRVAASERSTQRHFTDSTGTTRKVLDQIGRAQEAVRQLQTGKKPSDVAADVGYTDQAHMAKSLKKIMGVKPSDTSEVHKL